MSTTQTINTGNSACHAQTIGNGPTTMVHFFAPGAATCNCGQQSKVLTLDDPPQPSPDSTPYVSESPVSIDVSEAQKHLRQCVMNMVEIGVGKPGCTVALDAFIEAERMLIAAVSASVQGEIAHVDKLDRYGLMWQNPTDPVAQLMDDGYWTPWHIANQLLLSAQRDKRLAEHNEADLRVEAMAQQGEIERLKAENERLHSLAVTSERFRREDAASHCDEQIHHAEVVKNLRSSLATVQRERDEARAQVRELTARLEVAREAYQAGSKSK